MTKSSINMMMIESTIRWCCISSDYFDASHDQENLIFNNFYDWSEYTFNLIRNEKLNIGVKTHPNSVYESKAEESFKKKYPDLIWINSKISIKYI